MPKDFVPQPDPPFNTWVTKFYTWVNTNGTSRGVEPSQITAFTTLWNGWNTNWSDFQAKETAFHTATQDKDSAREAVEAMARALAAIIQKNPNTTNGDREAAGLTIPKTGRTPSPTPTTVPLLVEADTSTRATLRLDCADSATPQSRAKPAGAIGMHICEQIGGTAPVDPEQMEFLALATRIPFTVHFDAGDVGKTVYFALRWDGKNGQPGPWSQIYSAVIPG